MGANYKRRSVMPPTLSTEYLYTRFRKKLVNTAFSIFEWSGLPDTIDEQFLTMELIEHGVIGIIKSAGSIYAVRGNVGGSINEYYKPTEFIYANPILGSGQPTINKECAVLFLTKEDMMPFAITGGLSQLIDSTALLLADNIVSLNVAQKNSRLMILAAADDDSTASSAECVLNAMYNGKPYKIAQKRLTDSLEVNPIANLRTAENMRQLIENQQYLIAHFLQELGINANYNLKRERLNTAEIELNTDCLDTLVDNMESTINFGLEKCNELFGTNISFKIKRYGEETPENEIESDTEVALTQLENDSTESVSDENSVPTEESNETESTETETNESESTETETTETESTDTDSESSVPTIIIKTDEVVIEETDDSEVASTQLEKESDDSDKDGDEDV